MGYIFNEHFRWIWRAISVHPAVFFEDRHDFTAGMGNTYVVSDILRKGPSLDFSTSLRAAPAASSAKGLSTGRVTFDWTIIFAHELVSHSLFRCRPANSVPDTRFLRRSYISLGELRILGWLELDLGDKFSVSTSVRPSALGSTQIFVRGKKSSSRFNQRGREPDTDDGVNIGLDYNQDGSRSPIRRLQPTLK